MNVVLTNKDIKLAVSKKYAKSLKTTLCRIANKKNIILVS